ncbi:MAG: UbiA family prenyltransferase [Melioribacteraceae bacterium]|nr:UbiA family prenyltransferase [Melioribacteraceae bacterium]
MIKGLFRLIRFELATAAAICVFLGQLLALGVVPEISLSVFAPLSVFLISASILVLNDYFDIETDRINSPERPIPAGLVSPNQALIFAIILINSGFLLSYLINFTLLILAFVLTLIGFLYNRFFKKSGILGNFMVSFSVGMTFIFGGASVGYPFHNFVLFFAIVSALIDLGEEIAADAIDMEGDKLIQSKSIALKFGKQKALFLSSFIFSIVVLFSVLPFFLNWFSPFYLFPIVLMDISIIYNTLKILNRDDPEKRKAIRFLYLGSTSSIVLFIILQLFDF